MVGRDPGITLRDNLIGFRDLVSADMEWIDSRKVRFRRNAARVRITTLLLTATSTVVLGISTNPHRATFALPLVALVTVLSGLEGFFNWWSRWILMEEAQYRLNRLRDEMDYYIVMTAPADLDRGKLRGFYEEQQDIWSDVSRRWIEFRKVEGAPRSEPPSARA
jgi:hypothetical protein